MSDPRLQEKEALAALILRLRRDGMRDTELLKALEETPRGLFVPSIHSTEAYSSRLVPIECGAFMEGADLTMQMLYLLMVRPGNRVLEIGTGSGFTAAVMARIAERVITLDRFGTLIELAKRRFERIGAGNVAARQADGSQGLKGEGTFDRILVTASFEAMPRFFVDQLVAGGIAIVPIVHEDGACVLARLTKVGSRFEREDLFPVPFEPLVPGKALAL